MSGEIGPRYQILEKIGAGGMGVVYSALDTRLDRTVAVKTLPHIVDPKRRYQFLWEARAAAKLRHPNIVVVHDIALEDDREFIVMEYIPGGPLSEKLRQGPLPMPVALCYAVEIASALETAHQAGIIHRDLKPSNVLITPDGPVKLVDFGLARLQEQDAERPNALRAIAGTWGYMSPEQARGERATAQSDIFSFGVVLYEMLTGKRAFAGESDASVLAASLRDESPKAAWLVHDLPAALDQIVTRCLQKDPKRRFQHAGDLRQALEDVRGALPKTGWRSRFWHALRYAAPAAALLAIAWMVPYRSFEPKPNSMPIPLTSFPKGFAASAAWSPDGRQVAFCWDTDDSANSSVYLMEPGSSQTRRLTMGTHALNPAWSPDGRWIAYVHVVDEAHSSLELVSPLGGPPRTLLRATVLNDPAWTPDGRALVVQIRPDEDHPGVLWAVWLENGERRQLTWPPEGIKGDRQPALSPDGKVLAFDRMPYWRTSELFLLDLKTDLTPAGTPRQITRLGYVSNPAWTPDGRGIIIEAHRSGAGLWQVNRDGSHVRPVFGVSPTAMFPALARRPDGRTSLIFTSDVGRSSVWRKSTEHGSSAPPVELVASNRSQWDPSYSHNGKRLAFFSSRSGYEEVWVADSDGSNPVQLTNLRRQLAQVGDWSPSDDLIAFVSQDSGSRQIYMVGSSGGPAVPVTHGDGVDFGTGWSCDGRAYYYRAVKSGQFELRKVSSDGGESELVAAHCPNGFESQRGWLYYLRQQQPGQPPEMVRRTAHGDEVVPLTPPPCDKCPVIPRAEGIYYRAFDSNDLYIFDELNGRCTRFLKNADRLVHFTLSPDAHWLAYATAKRERGELMIVEDFHYRD